MICGGSDEADHARPAAASVRTAENKRWRQRLPVALTPV